MSTESASLHDPLRRRDVAATPEEHVRQWFISQLHLAAGVPLHMMGSEVPMKYGAKNWRADIVVYGRDGSPVAVVECKRPDIEPGRDTAAQALRYESVLGVRWIMITNGKLTLVFCREDGVFRPCAKFPSYEEMLCQL